MSILAIVVIKAIIAAVAVFGACTLSYIMIAKSKRLWMSLVGVAISLLAIIALTIIALGAWA